MPGESQKARINHTSPPKSLGPAHRDSCCGGKLLKQPKYTKIVKGTKMASMCSFSTKTLVSCHVVQVLPWSSLGTLPYPALYLAEMLRFQHEGKQCALFCGLATYTQKPSDFGTKIIPARELCCLRQFLRCFSQKTTGTGLTMVTCGGFSLGSIQAMRIYLLQCPPCPHLH